MSAPEPPDTPAATQAGAAGAQPDTARDTEFTAFYRATTRQLVAFLIAQGAALAEAADIAQDTMAKAYQGWHAIEYPRAWAHRVASRALVRHRLDARETPVAEPPEPSPLLRATDAALWERHHDIARALDRLPPRQRQVMAWTIFGFTPTEIADELRMTPGTVRQSLLSARRALSSWLARKDGDQ
ncbi:sigma-70 family RNA polymerase sigma factor [Amycolatopsis sp. 195334CR]|uniref:sigma-70 family RNA polymerase sigma factor n=1 Tax=Amycolatopsis sp. 195334CR TaxID=2814588 RepID=UPI001A8D5FD0|nr:sigma-70 family RNA polymerase sigma factor [Amycolatopsis sp. 195334CR]MBN6040023.1 sigma-70 family RNA polymerase sigma factor [Amycolatopsis sp. 195334CR]